MSEDKNAVPNSLQVNLSPIQQTLDKFLGAADVKAVYSEPIKHGDTLIIPTAEVLAGLGFGMGYGGAESAGEGEKSKDSGGGSGGGGGGRVLSRPVAVIIADQHGVRVEPVVDPTKIAIAFFTTLGFMAAMAGRMGRKKPRLEG
jgi:uncharacterized spore protein YtfJ